MGAVHGFSKQPITSCRPGVFAGNLDVYFTLRDCVDMRACDVPQTDFQSSTVGRPLSGLAAHSERRSFIVFGGNRRFAGLIFWHRRCFDVHHPASDIWAVGITLVGVHSTRPQARGLVDSRLLAWLVLKALEEQTSGRRSEQRTASEFRSAALWAVCLAQDRPNNGRALRNLARRPGQPTEASSIDLSKVFDQMR